MKRYKSTIVLLGITALLLIVYSRIPASSKTRGIVDEVELKVVSTVAPLPLMESNHLILVEFFAGY